MTRINLVPPKSLTTKHLVAEYREIMRLPGYRARSIARGNFSISEIPKKFTLGKGHVKFFYDKSLFLSKRFDELVEEMKARGIVVNFASMADMFISTDSRFNKDYFPTEEDIKISENRIKERLNAMVQHHKDRGR